MYVCICNALTETTVRSAARAGGASCPRTVYSRLGAAPDCCQCLGKARKIIEEERAADNSLLATAT